MARKNPAPARTRTRRPRMSAEEKRWQAEGDVHTLMRAEEIKANKTRMAAAKREAARQAAEARKVAGKINDSRTRKR